MNIDILGISFSVLQAVFGFLDRSVLVQAIKFFLFVYVVVLFADIVMLLLMRDLVSDFKRGVFGADRPLMSRSKAIIRWEKILARVENGNTSQFKVAILEADAMADEILGSIGYAGNDMAQRLENAKAFQLEHKESLAEAHQIRNRIIHEKDFVLTREETEKWLDNYRKFFEEVELF